MTDNTERRIGIAAKGYTTASGIISRLYRGFAKKNGAKYGSRQSAKALFAGALLSAAVSTSATAATTTFPVVSTVVPGGTVTAILTGLSPAALSNGVLNLSFTGDLNWITEYVSVSADGVALGTFAGLQCGSPAETASFTIPQATLATMVADGSIVLTFTGTADVNLLCSGAPLGVAGNFAFAVGGNLVYTGNGVVDTTPPVFTSFPPNMALSVNFPATTALVNWAAPTASDNSGPGTVITQTAGPASGAAFPLGATTVTYRAADPSGNFVDQSFVVTVSQTLPATVTYVVNSVADQSFAFSGAHQSLNMVVNTVGGTGQASSGAMASGQYNIAALIPAGFAFTQGSCNDTDSVFNTASGTGTLNLAAGENVICTFTTVNALGNATAALGTMLETRGQLITQNGPGLNRRIGRLTGARGGAGVISAYGASFSSAGLPMSVTVDGDTTSFSYSSRARGQSANSVSVNPVAVIGAASGNAEISQLAGKAAPFILPASAGIEAPEAAFDPMGQRWEVWAEGTITRFNDAAYDGTFGIVHVGADYLINPKLLVGLGAQVDWIDMTGLGGSLVSGTGFMVGPYVTAQLSDRLFFDARLAWGKSDNTVSPLGTYTDQVAGERMLATAALIGDFDKGDFNIRPEARLSYFSETTAAYVDGLGVSIPTVTVSFGSFELGPNVSRSFLLANAAQLTLTAGVEGIYTFALENTGAAPVVNPVTEGFRGRANAGVQYTLASGFDISTSLTYDGIGDTAINAWTAALGLKYSF